jgi:hypothetical protein
VKGHNLKGVNNMNAIDTESTIGKKDSEPEQTSSGFGKRIFSYRSMVGLSAAVLGSVFVHPGQAFGRYTFAARCSSVMLVLLGLALRAWGAASAGTIREPQRSKQIP